MARLFTAGAESAHAQSEGMTVTGTVSIVSATPTPRTGGFCFKATATNSYHIRAVTTTLGRTYYVRFAYLFPTNPTGLHRFFRVLTAASGQIMTLELNNTGRLIRLLNSANALVASGATALTAGQWYTVEVAINVPAAGNGTVEVRLDGVSEIATQTFSLGNTAIGILRFGCVDGNLGGLAYVAHDDLAVNDDQGSDQNSWPGVGGVYLLRPAADPGTGTSNANWTKPAGATTNRHTSVDNQPPIYLADSTAAGDAEKMLRNPTNAASDLELDLMDYTTAGVPSGETIKLVQPVAGLGSSSATDTTGALELVSNPAVSSKALTTFDNGIASATATTWPRADGNVVYNPTVTRGTQPRIRLSRAAANRTVMTNMLGLLVESQVAATTWDGVVAATTSYAISTAGAREAAGVAAATTSYAISTAGAREAAGVSSASTSYAISTVGERTANASVSAVTSFAIATAGTRERLGVVAASTSFAISTAGARETDGAASAVTSFSISTAGARETFGVVAATASFAISAAGEREAAGVSSVSFSFALTTAGERTATAIVSATTSFSISTSGERTANAASAVTSAFVISTAGQREAAAVVALPFNMAILVVPTGEPLGVVSRAVTFSINTEGAIDGQDIEGTVSLPVTFSISTAAERTTFGVVSAATSFSISTAGTRERLGVSSIGTQYTIATAGERTANAASSVHVTFTTATAGTRETLGVASLSFAFSISTDGIQQVSAVEGESALVFGFAISTDGQRGAVPMALRVYRMLYEPFAPIRSGVRGARGPTTPRGEQGAKTTD